MKKKHSWLKDDDGFRTLSPSFVLNWKMQEYNEADIILRRWFYYLFLGRVHPKYAQKNQEERKPHIISDISFLDFFDRLTVTITSGYICWATWPNINIHYVQIYCTISSTVSTQRAYIQSLSPLQCPYDPSLKGRIRSFTRLRSLRQVRTRQCWSQDTLEWVWARSPQTSK